MGIFGAKLVSPVCGGLIQEFEGGVANNAVPDRASALVKADIAGLKNAPNITLEPEGDGVRVRGWGKAGHAAMPEGTVNAIGLVADYLLDNGLCNEAERAYLEAIAKLHHSTAGQTLGIDCADGPFGPLTIIGGRIYMEDGRMVQTMDSRYPTCTNGDTIAAAIRSAVGEGATLVDVDAAEPFYIAADTPAIRACIDTYNEVTGENATPFTMGGGTYARHFPYAVSFGPERIAADTPAIRACIDTYNEVTGENATPFTMGGGTYARHFPYAVSFGPERSDTQLPDFGGPMHGANEAAPVSLLLEALKIYILALLRLEQIDF